MEAEASRTRSTSSAGSDTGLARRLRQGDERACGELWHRFGAQLHGFAASRLAGDRDLADEMVVQTLAAAVQSIARFNSRRSTLSAWVYGIARRRIHAELRKQRRKKSVPPSAQVPMDAMSGTASGANTSADVAARLDAQREVAELAKSLSHIEMEVLTLHYVHQFPEREIAQIVGRSHRAVHSILHRAKQKARERLMGHVD